MKEGKWVPGLSAEMPVAEAAEAVLAARFKAVRHYLPLAAEKPYDDAEHVHQLRVATRRAGAALRVFRDCLPRKSRKTVRSQLRTIRQAAGDARDWDVFLIGLPDAKAFATAKAKPALDYLIGYGMGERSASQARLVATAESAGVVFLDGSADFPRAAHSPRGDNPPSNFGELAVSQFAELLREFEDAVKANPAQPAEFHRVRILAKRSRYALEIFADCFPPAFKDVTYPALEQVQEVLGEIQDATVGQERLATLRDRLRKTVPREWPRLRPGIEGLLRALRSRIPAGRKSFQAWRKEWNALMEGMKMQVVAATVVAEE
jgi:CHAD domain-containing protein